MAKEVKGFFYPDSLVIIGVSDAASNLARVIVENLERFGYGGRVYPVGNSGEAVGGRRILRNVAEIQESPDLAVLLVPARFVPEQLAACGRKGIRRVIIETGGFSEYSAENRVLEDQAMEIARQYGMRLVGPNCFGVINFDIGLTLPAGRAFCAVEKQPFRRGYVVARLLPDSRYAARSAVLRGY